MARGGTGAEAPPLAARPKVGNCSVRGQPECDLSHLMCALMCALVYMQRNVTSVTHGSGVSSAASATAAGSSPCVGGMSTGGVTPKAGSNSTPKGIGGKTPLDRARASAAPKSPASGAAVGTWRVAVCCRFCPWRTMCCSFFHCCLICCSLLACLPLVLDMNDMNMKASLVRDMKA